MNKRILLATEVLGGSGTAYYLRDKFTTALSAGAVNATASEPGPGTRNVTDVGNKISLSGGKMVISGGTGTAGQTGFYLTPAITRAAGLSIKCRFDSASYNVFYIPMITAASVAAAGFNNVSCFVQDSSGVLLARKTTTGTSPTLATLAADNTVYELVTVLRSQGRYVFLKTGTGDYRFLWLDEWDTTATLYLGEMSHLAGAAVNIDEISAASNKFYNVVYAASDSFNRSNGAMGNTDGAGHAEANSGSGLAWTDRVGNFTIGTNKAVGSTLSGGVAFATVDSGYADAVIRVAATRSAGNFGIVFRWVDASNYAYVYHDGTNQTIRQVVSGSDSQVTAPAAATYAAGGNYMVSLSGTSVRVHYNEFTLMTGTINAALTGTNHGLYTSDVGNTFDNFVIIPTYGHNALGSI